jgi:hypothetical protein
MEIFKPFEAKWINIGKILPGNQTTPIRNINENGYQESIIFYCSEDDSGSVVFKFTKESNDTEDLPDIIKQHLKPIDIIVLEKGQTHIIEVKKHIGGATKLLRISHT